MRDRDVADDEFLFELYFDTRAAEMGSWGWSEAQMRNFAKLQFTSRELAYSEQYPDAQDRIIMQDGVPVGRLLVSRATSEIRLVDIAILRAYRNLGHANEVLCGLTGEADREQISISLHVDIFNPAKRLYERAGFEMAGERGGYFLMRRPPNSIP